MAYLGNGIYDLLDVVRASNNPQINYEGLYQDASAPMATSSLFQSMKPGYEFRNDSYMRNAYMNEGDDLSGNISTDYNRRLDFKNYFNNRPLTPTDGVNRFIGFNPRIGIVNAGLPINNTNSISAINNTSMIEDYPIVSTTSEDETDQQYIQEQEPKGIAKLFQFLSNLPTPMNILRGGLESLQGFNQRIRNTDFGQSQTLAEYFQKRRDRKAREEAAERGAAKQAQAAARASAIAQEAANRDYARRGLEGDGGGFDSASGGTFGSSVNDAGSFSDYS
jgi:hypothetical protein